MKIKIVKAKVLITFGTDVVCLYTNLPSPFPPEISKEKLTLEFKVTKGKGVKYVKNNFHIDPEVVITEVKKNRYIKR